ncbi:SCO2400 family protein, partial [Streptomyces sp. URMC 125]|uniref:SCO2400 family protein n=1 Tax=Streptomyces sp. URMC 125 TaxID=3423419 RepID=UPI003F1AC58C
MTYCVTCRRHLNGALCCPGCGTPSRDLAPADTAPRPLAAPHAPYGGSCRAAGDGPGGGHRDAPGGEGTGGEPDGDGRGGGRRADRAGRRRRAALVGLVLGAGLSTLSTPSVVNSA